MTGRMTMTLVSILLCGLLMSRETNAFLTTPTQSWRLTQLWGKGIKRGQLGKSISPDEALVSSKNKVPTKKSSSTKSSSGGGISPALAEWAKSGEIQGNVKDAVVDAKVTEFVPFETTTAMSTNKGKSSRRTKQSARKEGDKERDAAVIAIVSKLEEILEQKSGTKSLRDILDRIRDLTMIQGGNLRLLTAGANNYSYRLAWVGGDDAISHIGTGLHKVPLARIQEVFLTCQGRNRIEILEVIRILGPFPNVRNTLQGDSKVEHSETGTDWEIAMNSMVDGTGKEILAGTEQNVRRVKLQVYFADPNAIVAVIPPESSIRSDPFEDGVRVLFFVRENDLDAKLETLRVA